jgi:hypothetical protein
VLYFRFYRDKKVSLCVFRAPLHTTPRAKVLPGVSRKL